MCGCRGAVGCACIQAAAPTRKTRSAGKTARVTSVHEDVDGNQHVAVVVDDDPAADLHEWYGRYLYFAPDEVEPLETISTERNSIWRS